MFDLYVIPTWFGVLSVSVAFISGVFIGIGVGFSIALSKTTYLQQNDRRPA